MREIIVRKLTSRKFWFALATVISGLLMFFGYAETDTETVMGAILTMGGAIGYMISEGMIDAKNVGSILQAIEDIIEKIKGGKDDEK